MSGTFLDTSQHAEHFPDRMDVQVSVTGVLNARGVTGPPTWSNVPGLVSLPVLVVAKVGDEIPVVEGGAKIVAASTHEILMQDYYPQIQSTMRGIIDGKIYEFAQCDHEGMKTVGIIKARRVTG